MTIDLLLGLSLFYAAFHGILLSVYGNQNEDMPPLRCLFTALHLHIWVRDKVGTDDLLC
jgi:hypothetical protein